MMLMISWWRNRSRHLGGLTSRWIADYYRMPVARATKALGRLLDLGMVHETSVDGLGKAYVHARNVGLARRAAQGKLQPQRTVLLSPFDPVVWHRLRASELFGFDYLIECYTPAEKRIYGYFTLPILHRGQLVGRLDPKAHRATGVFEVKALHLGNGFRTRRPLRHRPGGNTDWFRCLALEPQRSTSQPQTRSHSGIV